LPKPQSVSFLKGFGFKSEKLRQIFLEGEFKQPVMGEILSQLTVGKSMVKGTFELILDTKIIILPTDEGYIMNFSDEKVEIKLQKVMWGYFTVAKRLNNFLKIPETIESRFLPVE